MPERRRATASDIAQELRIHATPRLYPRLPVISELRQSQNACARVLTTLGVMRRRCVQRVWPVPQALKILPMEPFYRKSERQRISANLVERGERIRTVERSILDSLGHYGTGHLLEAQGKFEPLTASRDIKPVGMIKQEHRGEEVENRPAERRVAADENQPCRDAEDPL